MRGWSLVAFWLNPLDFYHKSSSKAWGQQCCGGGSPSSKPPLAHAGSLLTREKWTLDEEKDGQTPTAHFPLPIFNCSLSSYCSPFLVKFRSCYLDYRSLRGYKSAFNWKHKAQLDPPFSTWKGEK